VLKIYLDSASEYKYNMYMNWKLNEKHYYLWALWDELVIRFRDGKFFGRRTMATAKNYTDEMVAQMKNDYTANPTRETVDTLAKEFGKTTRSIIAKLSREGIYQAQPRTTKTGAPVISKTQYVNAINAHFGIEMPTLVKAGKQDLASLAEVLGLEVVAN
jgi:bisphosphoglycerate-dependent phosphoglycerate mutase